MTFIGDDLDDVAYDFLGYANELLHNLVHRFHETSHSRLWPIGREMLEFYRQDMIRILETLY